MEIAIILLLISVFIYTVYAKSQTKMPASKEVLSKVQNLISTSPIFIASKSYCPYCAATLNTFKTLGIKPTVVQLNEVSDGNEIQTALKDITGQSTVPNIFIDGKHIGGNSDLQTLKSTGELERLLKL